MMRQLAAVVPFGTKTGHVVAVPIRPTGEAFALQRLVVVVDGWVADPAGSGQKH